MKSCPNPDCPGRYDPDEPAKFKDHVRVCSECGTRLVFAVASSGNDGESREESETDLAHDRCPDCGGLSLESRTPPVVGGAPLPSKARVVVPRGHGLTCENCGRMWTRRK